MYTRSSPMMYRYHHPSRAFVPTKLIAISMKILDIELGAVLIAHNTYMGATTPVPHRGPAPLARVHFPIWQIEAVIVLDESPPAPHRDSKGAVLGWSFRSIQHPKLQGEGCRWTRQGAAPRGSGPLSAASITTRTEKQQSTKGRTYKTRRKSGHGSQGFTLRLSSKRRPLPPILSWRALPVI